MSEAKNNILARLKAAQDKRGEIEVTKPDFASPVYHPLNESLVSEFKKNLELVGGKVVICNSAKEISDHISILCKDKNQEEIFCKDKTLLKFLGSELKIRSEENDFLDLNIGVTGCEFLVAHLGSVLISSAQISGRRLNVFPETHIVIAGQSQITNYFEDALENIQNKYKNELPSLISNITGPSRTADIEKTLVMGMHGPRSLVVIISVEPLNN